MVCLPAHRLLNCLFRPQTNLKSQSFEMAEKSGFETLKTGSALLKKGTFAEKVEQRAVIKFCVDIEKTSTDTHKCLKQSEKHSKVSRSLILRQEYCQHHSVSFR
jgi:hypothetical protein